MTTTREKRARAAFRDFRRRQREDMKARGCKRIDCFVHSKDFPRVAKYIDTTNRRRFPKGKRPPLVIRPPRPRGGVTVMEAAARLKLRAYQIHDRIKRRLLRVLPKIEGDRRLYIAEASVRTEEERAEMLAAALSTEEAARYLSRRGRFVSPGTLHNWRLHGRGPTYVRHVSALRYTTEDLDRWLSQEGRR